jgi:hypothetical protein
MVMPMDIEGISSRLEFSLVYKERECIALPLFYVLGNGNYCLFCEIRFIRSSLLSLRSLYPRSS